MFMYCGFFERAKNIANLPFILSLVMYQVEISYIIRLVVDTTKQLAVRSFDEKEYDMYLYFTLKRHFYDSYKKTEVRML